MAGQIFTTTNLPRKVMIDPLFDQGEELMEKLGCQVFILVSEDGICSSYMGSEVFLKDFCSSGLKIKPCDVLRTRKNIQTQPNFWIAEDNGFGQQILYRSKQETDSTIQNNQSIKCEVTQWSNCSYDTVSVKTVQEEIQTDKCSASNDIYSAMAADLTNCRKVSDNKHTKQEFVSETNVETLDTHERRGSVSMETDANQESCDVETILDVNDKTFCITHDITVSPCHQNNEERKSENALDNGHGKGFEKVEIKTKEVNFATQEGAIHKPDMPNKRNVTSKQRTKTRKKKNFSNKEEHGQNTSVVVGRKRRVRRKIGSEGDVEHHRETVKKIFRESNDNAVYLCERCGLSCKSSKLLEVHKQRAACSERKCRFCGIKFPYREWQEHLLNHHVTELIVYGCHVCEKQFWQRTSFYDHVKGHEVDGNALSCDVCGATFGARSSLRRHKVKHRRTELHCDYCEYKTYCKYQLNIHMKRHSDSEAFNCKFCGKHLVTLGSLNNHIQRFHIQSKYQCTDCEKEFAFLDELNHHIARHHQDNIKHFICEKCGKGFQTKVMLTRHLRVHTVKALYSVRSVENSSATIPHLGCTHKFITKLFINHTSVNFARESS
ncbi:putative zinc finger protein 286B isoform X2 [Ptychodera flava]|uniref:putative zinc finger protein 286B isoform X2 n=1 Tax=Ptychodera flava TaxID=63121 RepID=UPI003969E163